MKWEQKTEKTRDPIQALYEVLQQSRNRKTSRGYFSVLDMMGKSIAAFHSYAKGKNYTGHLQSIDVKAYVDKYLSGAKENIIQIKKESFFID